MVNNETLPEGTDAIITGAGRPAAGGTDPLTPAATTSTATPVDPVAAPNVMATEPTRKDKVVAKVREGRDQVATEAAGKARGLLGDGLVKGSSAIGSVAKLVNDTAASLDEQLGPQYGDYARSAASYLDDTAARIQSKNADELIDDTRQFVRKSPAVALGAAAVVGFALARLVQSGFDAEKVDDLDDFDAGSPSL